MDLNQVALFTRVVEAGSFTAAAKHLGLPVSSVSRGIVHLEESLGARLLQRTTRKLSLTEAGRHFFDEVTGAMGALEEAAERVQDQRREASGLVRITLPVDLGDDFFARTVSEFCSAHPHVRIDVELSNRRVDLVQEGFDLALRGGKMEDSSLVGRKVADTDLGLYATSEYLARRGNPQSLAELAEHDCLSLRHMVSGWVLTGPEGAETVKVKGPILANDFAVLTRTCSLGMGIALLPTGAGLSCGRDRLSLNLIRVLPEYVVGGGALWLLWPSARHMPMRVALFRDYLTAEIQRHQGKCDEMQKKLHAGASLDDLIAEAANDGKRRAKSAKR
jgi:DNA-binding transcriptional LysR family regulator